MEPYQQIPPLRLVDGDGPLSRDIRRRGLCVGVGLIGLSLLSDTVLSLATLILRLFGVKLQSGDTYLGLGFFGFMLLYAGAYAVMMGLPMTLSAAAFRAKVNPFGKRQPVPFGRCLLWLFAGLGLCAVANQIAGQFMEILVLLGVPYPDMPDYTDGTLPNFLVNVVVFAVLPGILEEVFFRGYVLELFRPYNRIAALLISSVFFGLMHGNVLQIPFAFLVGLALGLIYLRTENIFLCIGVHFLNNLLSEAESFGLFLLPDDAAAQTFFLSSIAAVELVCGLIAGVLLFFTRRREKQPAPEVSGHLVWKHGVWRSPTMIVATVLFVLSTLINTFLPLFIQ